MAQFQCSLLILYIILVQNMYWGVLVEMTIILQHKWAAIIYSRRVGANLKITCIQNMLPLKVLHYFFFFASL